MIDLPSNWKDDVEVIENEERIAILEKLKERPWAVRELSEELGISPERVVHHINMLRRAKSLQLKDDWVQQNSFGKVYSVNKKVAQIYLDTVRSLAERLAKA